MANLDTEAKRRSAMNYGMGGFHVSPPIDGGLANEFDRRLMSNSYGAGIAGQSAIGVFWDVRAMDRAISESGGEATNSNNLGTVHYTYEDVKSNDSKVTLPFG